MTSLHGSGRRCHLAKIAAPLTSSFDFWQGTFEKIYLHGLFCQQSLQLMDLLTVGRRVRAGPRRIFSRLDRLEFSAPLVKASPGHPQLLRQLADVFAGPQEFDGHPLKLLRVSLPLHFAAPFPAKCAHPYCLISRVQSILVLMGSRSCEW
jgi:hypothetical protein